MKFLIITITGDKQTTHTQCIIVEGVCESGKGTCEVDNGACTKNNFTTQTSEEENIKSSGRQLNHFDHH